MKPPNKWFRWIRFLDRIHYFNREEPLVHKDHIEAMRSLADPEAMKQFKYKQMHTTLDFEGVHPDIIKFWKSVHKAMKLRDIPVRAFELKRSHARQQELYDKGVSKAVPGQSAHNYGCAIDIIHSKKAWNLSKKQWDCMVAIQKECARKCNVKLISGDDWDFWDPAHWELKNWRQICAPQIRVLTKKQLETQARLKTLLAKK